ncbi:hypothetical protein ABIC83_002974 [Roseateles asaccharophilus]|uniref:DUF4262 domain-containing protein n=1 Tax=Roseateles asaccharophilus TaxID=582607 RepID=UPI0038371937
MSTLEERVKQIRAANEKTIRAQGFIVENVFATEDAAGPDFNYTVGLHDRGLPELVVLGLPLNVGHHLVQEIAKFALAQKAMGNPLPTEVQLPQFSVPFTLRPADPSKAKEFAVDADVRSNGAAAYLQIMWPDKHGRMPWAQEAEESFRKAQPVLGFIQ